MRENTGRDTVLKVRFIVSDFECASDEITRILGLQPTTTWRRGDRIPRTTMARKQNGWRLDSPAMPAGDFEEQFNVLLKVVMPHSEKFKNLPPQSEVELSCVIYVYDQRPVISFSADAVRCLASIGATIDVDYYDLTEESEDKEATPL